MSTNYAIIAHMKIKTEKQFNEIVLGENERKIFADNVDKDRSYKNIFIRPCPYHSFDNFVNIKREFIQKSNQKNGTRNRMVRKVKNKITKEKEYQAMMQQFVFTHSPGAMTEQQSIEYMKRAYKFIADWFKNCEIISCIIHLDETTPHAHITVDYFDVKRNKFIQNELQKEGKTDINAIRDAFQEEVAYEFNLLRQDGTVVGEHDGKKADIEKAKLKTENEKLKYTTDITKRGKPVEKDEAISYLKRSKRKLKQQIKKLEEKILKQQNEDQKTLLELEQKLISRDTFIVEKDNEIEVLKITRDELLDISHRKDELVKIIEDKLEHRPRIEEFEKLKRELEDSPGKDDLEAKNLEIKTLNTHIEDIERFNSTQVGRLKAEIVKKDLEITTHKSMLDKNDKVRGKLEKLFNCDLLVLLDTIDEKIEEDKYEYIYENNYGSVAPCLVPTKKLKLNARESISINEAMVVAKKLHKPR